MALQAFLLVPSYQGHVFVTCAKLYTSIPMAKVSRLMTFTFLVRCCIAWSWSRRSPDQLRIIQSVKHDTQAFSSQMHGSFCGLCIILYITFSSPAELSHEEIDLISKHTGDCDLLHSIGDSNLTIFRCIRWIYA
jgi:hypothetical protein